MASDGVKRRFPSTPESRRIVADILRDARSRLPVHPPVHGPMRLAIPHLLAVWRWPARLRCHGSIVCCQYVDRPNCNHPSAPAPRRHR